MSVTVRSPLTDFAKALAWVACVMFITATLVDDCARARRAAECDCRCDP